MITFGSLFAGVGGFDLGFERAGMTCSWQVEIDDYCQKVLSKHWPSVPKFRDIKEFPPPGFDAHVDVICGGFPCQDISSVGKRRGIAGEKSSLWKEMLRVVRTLRPKVVVVENVSALLIRGMDTVLGDLAECGYDAGWEVLSAKDVGAPHLRKRVFIIAYTKGVGEGRLHSRSRQERQGEADTDGICEDVSDSVCEGLPLGIGGSLGAAAWDSQPKRQDSFGWQWWATVSRIRGMANGVSTISHGLIPRDGPHLRGN